MHPPCINWKALQWDSRWRQSTDDTCHGSEKELGHRLISSCNEAKPRNYTVCSSIRSMVICQKDTEDICIHLIFGISYLLIHLSLCYPRHVGLLSCRSVLVSLILLGQRREEGGGFPKETSVRIHESILCGSLLLERHPSEICKWFDTAADLMNYNHNQAAQIQVTEHKYKINVLSEGFSSVSSIVRWHLLSRLGPFRDQENPYDIEFYIEEKMFHFLKSDSLNSISFTSFHYVLSGRSD